MKYLIFFIAIFFYINIWPLDISKAIDLIEKSQIVLVGETHGSSEAPEIIKEMVPHNFSHLFIEWPISDQKFLDDYMDGDDTVLEMLREEYFGCPNAAKEYFSLFSFVREYNRCYPEKQIILRPIDVPAPVRSLAEENRDQHMFQQIKTILDNNLESRILVYVGACHAAKTGTTPYPNAKGKWIYQRTLGSVLNQDYPGCCLSLKIGGDTISDKWLKADATTNFFDYCLDIKECE